MDSIIDSTIGMATRLASTIPTLSSTKHEQQSSTTNDITNHLLTNLTTPQSLSDILTLTIIVILALELLSKLVYHIPPKVNSNKGIPVRGKHLDNFTYKDYLFIGINKCMTGMFVYCYFGYLWSVRKLDDHVEHDKHDSHKEEDAFGQHNCCNGGSGIWSFTDLSFTNTILPIPILFITYDFFYTLLHWLLHIKSIYTYIHKHHHYQKAPSRANIDAVNVHPIEFFLGEFNHVWVLHLVVSGMPSLIGFHGMDVSWLGALLFIGIGGALAGLNHTRHDVVASIPSLTSTSSSNDKGEEEEKNTKKKENGWTIFDSKHHDVHHRIPQSNYGQYTVFWDRIFGTFREYNEDDRVNPAYQLDPLTGKTKKE